MSKPKNTPAPAKATFTKPASATPTVKRGTSTVENPVGAVWVTCLNAQAANGGKPAKRSDLHRMCQEAGVAYYTTRTQVQRYLKWNKEGADQAKLPKGVVVAA